MRLSASLDKHNVGHFGFTAMPFEDLGASEYTLATIVADKSGSVYSFQSEMEATLKAIVEACKHSKRVDNLLLRTLSFSNHSQEVHGFKFLTDIDPNNYDGILNPSGATALFDACVDALEASNNYGKELVSKDYTVNGIVFVITDGENNSGKCSASDVKKAIASAVSGENMDSMISVLVAVNVENASCQHALQNFKNEAGFDEYIEIKNATKSELAKLAKFVSQSIISQSQAITTGSASQLIKW